MPIQRVLLIEDDDLVANALTRALRIHGIQALHAANGERALQYAREEPFDAVVSDLMLPDTNGRRLHAQIVGMRPELEDRYVVMSGGSPDAELWAWVRSMPRSLRKPFHNRDLVNLLQSMP